MRRPYKPVDSDQHASYGDQRQYSIMIHESLLSAVGVMTTHYLIVHVSASRHLLSRRSRCGASIWRLRASLKYLLAGKMRSLSCSVRASSLVYQHQACRDRRPTRGSSTLTESNIKPLDALFADGEKGSCRQHRRRKDTSQVTPLCLYRLYTICIISKLEFACQDGPVFVCLAVISWGARQKRVVDMVKLFYFN